MSEPIYMDNAASTRTDPSVVEAMLPYFTDVYAVASSQFSHAQGMAAREGLDAAREKVASRLNCLPDEIVFTSGGTEANNLAIKGTAWAIRGQKNHVIFSKIEHVSVIHSIQWLEKEGFTSTAIDVDGEGHVDLDNLKNAFTEKTYLVSLQHGNQEVGTIQPIQTVAEICKERGILFHTDAALSFTHEIVDLKKIPADLLTVSAHKIHGPKGVGALFVRQGTALKKWNHGGYNEFDLRGGTENISGIVGFGKAVEISIPEDGIRIRKLQKMLLELLESSIEGVRINGPRNWSERLPGNVNVSFDFIEGESVVLHLDMRGISVITGSACFSRSLEPSHVMMAMGYSHERAHGSIRFSLSRFTREEEITAVVRNCREVVEKLRSISPMKSKG
jgi:cysteine desulfurase